MAKFRGKIQDGTIDIPGLIIKIALIWFILTFLVFPNVNLLLRVFVKDEHFTLEAVSKIMRSARAMKSLKNSFTTDYLKHNYKVLLIFIVIILMT